MNLKKKYIPHFKHLIYFLCYIVNKISAHEICRSLHPVFIDILLSIPTFLEFRLYIKITQKPQRNLYLFKLSSPCSPEWARWPLQGTITFSFLSRWSLWNLVRQQRHSSAGGGLNKSHKGRLQTSQLDGKW